MAGTPDHDSMEPVRTTGLARWRNAHFLSAGLLAGALPWLARSDCQGAQPPAATPPSPREVRVDDAVKALYTQHCASCHGVEGHGDGPAGVQLFPKPRSFRDSPFRFAATGETPEQVKKIIERTIAQGVPRSVMPGFSGILTAPQIQSLAAYVHALSQDVAAPGAPVVEIAPNPMPEFTPALIARGSELFQSQACINCHGPKGHGDGPSMVGLTDSIGRPIRPADLASGMFKSGPLPQDLFRTIITGVPGTPMISYGPLLVQKNKDGTHDDRDVWALVAFIKSIGPAQNTGIPAGAEIRVLSAENPEMLTNQSHPAWLSVPRTVVAVKPLWQRVEYAETVSVAAVRSGDKIAFQLSWDDATCDVSSDLNRFADGVAVMFALTEEVPSLPMAVSVAGQRTGPPVYIWSWKASRQFDASLGRPHDAGEPRTFADSNFHEFGPAPDKPAPRPEPTPGLDNDLNVNAKYNLSAPAVGNPHTDPALSGHATLEANAEGFGTLTYQPAAQQDVTSTAIWANGRWFVNIVRPLKTGQALDIDLASSHHIPIAFAVWDGSRGDRDGIKHISGWHSLTVNP